MWNRDAGACTPAGPQGRPYDHERSYENVIALRVVESQDGMTANWVSLAPEVLARISNRIINQVRGVNRVV